MPENPQMSVIGKPQRRIDGPLKVSGTAMYTSDFHFPDLVYGVPVEAMVNKFAHMRFEPSGAIHNT